MHLINVKCPAQNVQVLKVHMYPCKHTFFPPSLQPQKPFKSISVTTLTLISCLEVLTRLSVKKPFSWDHTNTKFVQKSSKYSQLIVDNSCKSSWCCADIFDRLHFLTSQMMDRTWKWSQQSMFHFCSGLLRVVSKCLSYCILRAVTGSLFQSNKSTKK